LRRGVIEASTYAGTQYIIGAWYKPNEIGKRVGLFSACGQAGTMFAGIMMSALFETMNGSAGLPGWKWGFIIDGLITLPVAIFGFLYFPDLPETTKASYLTREEKELAVRRLPPKSEEGHKVGWNLIKRTVLTRDFWILTIFWGIGGLLESLSSYTCMLLWMKTAGYSVLQNNRYPLGIQGVTIVCILACAIALDVSGRYLPWGWLVCIVQLITAVILLFWNRIDTATKFVAFCKSC
jgi:ACS family pantothenate transporter-like MFS transporter